MEAMVNIALRAARKAGDKIAHAVERKQRIKIDQKGSNDFVTEVDKNSEQEIIYHLGKAYPEHSILGEESGTSGNPESDYQWIIDPLDGTTNFIHGIPHFAVSIGCTYKGKLEHAVVYNPMTREEFTASRGRGAYLNGNRIRVSGHQSMAGALFATGIPFNRPSFDEMENYQACLHDIAGKTAGIRRLGVASLDLAYLAAGRFDGFWEMYLKPWDIAAGLLLIKEAGGLVSDFQGSEQMLKNGHVVAATPKLFKSALQIVQNHLGHLK